MKGRGASLIICTGGHMSDLLIDAQLHFFQKLHDHRVVIKLPSKYHNNTQYYYYSPKLHLYLSYFSIFFSLNFPAYFCLNLLPSWPCLYLIPYNWDCAKSRSSKTPSIGELWLMIYQLVNFILEQFFIFYLSLHSKFHHFCWAAPVLHIILTRCSGCPSLPFFPKLDSP